MALRRRFGVPVPTLIDFEATNFPLDIERDRTTYCEPAAMANTKYNRTPMFHPRVLFRTPIPTAPWCCVAARRLHHAGCRRRTPVPSEPPMAEPEPEMPPEILTAVINQNATVRTRPGTGHAVVYRTGGRPERGRDLAAERTSEPARLDLRRPDGHRRGGDRGAARRGSPGNGRGRGHSGTHSRTHAGARTCGP